MPLPVTPNYERRLSDLRRVSPDIAALTERIVLDLRPQVLATSTDTLEAQLLDHLQAVALRQARSVTRFTVWMGAVVSAGALTQQQAAVFVNEVGNLGASLEVMHE